ncbi:metal-dependent hydrolase [Anaerolineales bacterium HSG6]|nr:metal-dependent hydrolase [Anaerolineales bacterium HSG6]
MMPPGHVAVSWGISRLLQRTNPALAQLDYRLLAIGSLLPDFIDKPLAIWLFTDSHSSQNITHSLFFNWAILVITLLWIPRLLPYCLAFNGHLIADKMWNHTETFWWPWYGWDQFWHYRFMNTPEAMLQVYIDILTHYPHVWLIEIVAVLILGYFFYQQKWYRWQSLKRFVMTGRLSAE